MLAPDRASRTQTVRNVRRKDYSGSKSQTSSPRLVATPPRKSTANRQVTVKPPQVSRELKVPLWLSFFNFISSTSTGLSALTIVGCFIVYGLTVSAPTQWTQKYRHLQELQQRERELTFSDEVLRNQLAQEANRGDSGLITPDLSTPPVFLPRTEVEPIEVDESVVNTPKKVQPIFPIAY